MTAPLDFCMAVQGAHASLQLKLDFELGLHHGIGLVDFTLLDVLDRAAGARVPMSQLVRPLGRPQSGVLRQVIVLEKIGLVRRADDHGSRQIMLLPAGRAVLQGARDTTLYICAAALESIDSAALARACAALTALQHAPELALS